MQGAFKEGGGDCGSGEGRVKGTDELGVGGGVAVAAVAAAGVGGVVVASRLGGVGVVCVIVVCLVCLAA